MRPVPALLATAVVVVALSACGGDDGTDDREASRTSTSAPSPTPDGAALSEPTPEQEAALVAALEAVGFIPAVADEGVAVILGESVCHRYGLGDDHPAVISTLTRTGMPVERAAQAEEAATSTICPEYASRY